MTPPNRPDWAPESIDLERPNSARIYDYLLGGAANFEPDRQFTDKLLEVWPELRKAARLNRSFLRRAVRFCTEAGIRQFLDVGSGIPTVGNVHEIAQSVAPESRVLYVDKEPVAAAHGKLMLEGNDRAGAIQADQTDTDAILGSDAAGRLLDLAEPVAILMVAVLHFVPDDADPHAAVARYVDAMAPGSYLVLSHGIAPAGPGKAEEVQQVYHQSNAAAGVFRSRERIAAFFDGTELVEPGLVFVPEWRPESPNDVAGGPAYRLGVAGVGRKP